MQGLQENQQKWASRPFFFASKFLGHAFRVANLGLHQLIEQSLKGLGGGLGFELVEFEFAGRGLLRIYIDRPYEPAKSNQEQIDSLVSIEDCELVSRQLSRVFEVEGVNYERLEISSPGLDRLLSRTTDFIRFAGLEAVVKLRVPLAGRKNFQGILVYQPASSTQPEDQFGVDYDDKKDGQPLRMNFVLNDVDKARLVPVIDFNRHKKAKKKVAV